MHDHHDETAAMEPIERPQPVRANVPQNQEAILAWALRYTEALAEAPAVYETSAEEAAELRRLALAWSDARAAQKTGRGSRAEKEVARTRALPLIRNHARIMRRHPHVPTEAKLKLGFELCGW